jgi:hypothetical protein
MLLTKPHRLSLTAEDLQQLLGLRDKAFQEV